jgi:hypothetical protein
MLNNRPQILGEKFKILIDTAYFNALLSSKNTIAQAFLEYRTCNRLEFIRTPGETIFESLQKIPYYEYDEDDSFGIKVLSDKSESKIRFGYRKDDIESAGQFLYEKESLTRNDENSLTKVFIWAAITRNSNNNLFITEDRKILKKRSWFESNFPGRPLGITIFDEAREVIDLFLKHNHQYHVLSHFSCNKGGWYLLSFRSKIKHFHFGIPILDAFARRFTYILMSLDQIGIQYYLGVNNDTIDDKLYYFNYFVVLLTGIFDSLAIYTKDKYGLEFESAPQKVTLNPNSGKEFLILLREKNPQLRELVKNNSQFIKLVYELREVIIHRDMFAKVSNFIEVADNIVHLVRHCKDKPQKYEEISEWGLYQMQDTFFLEPYHFAKAAIRNLVNFSDSYLELLGFGNFVDELKQNEPQSNFAQEIETFEIYKLGI